MSLSTLADRVAVMLRPSPDPFHVEPPAVQERRRILVVVVLVVGAVLLGLALGTHEGDDLFYVLTLALPIVWFAGSFASGPLHLGSRDGHRLIAVPLGAAVLSWGVFVAGDELFRLVPFLHRQVLELLHRADDGALWFTLLIAITNGIGEEVFFRGAVYSAFGRHHPAVWSTVVYVAVTSVGGNASLVVAAVVMGTIFALERRATRGVLAPILTHVVWSTLVVLALPR